MATCKGDEVLVGLFYCPQPSSQTRDRSLFKGNNRRHFLVKIRRDRLISYSRPFQGLALDGRQHPFARPKTAFWRFSDPTSVYPLVNKTRRRPLMGPAAFSS